MIWIVFIIIAAIIAVVWFMTHHLCFSRSIKSYTGTVASGKALLLARQAKKAHKKGYKEFEQ